MRLQDKIKEYLGDKWQYGINLKWRQKIAKDIAEIVEKEWQDRIDCEKCNDLQDENTELKKELKEQEKIYNGLQKFAVTVEKENTELKEAINKINSGNFAQKYLSLKAENTSLKQQLKAVKYDYEAKSIVLSAMIKSYGSIKFLDKEEVDDLVKEIITIACSTWCNEDGEPLEELPMQVWEDFETDFNRVFTAICNLAYEPITKDKIIEVLKHHEYYALIDHINNSDMEGVISIEQIANEILNKSDKEE